MRSLTKRFKDDFGFGLERRPHARNSGQSAETRLGD
tara:strand:+ start:1595 stop:1702 length:108 start_codon:yes stop_codon:yes gene_type:complete